MSQNLSELVNRSEEIQKQPQRDFLKNSYSESMGHFLKKLRLTLS